MLQQGSLFDNRYELTRFIGRGGFAEVWLVTDRLTGLEEALKIYAPGGGMDEDGLRLFAKELSVVHDLRHTNLLTPKMLGQYENQPYLILPYCPNGSLNKFVGQCSEDDAWKILGQVAAGLAYLHQRGIVHQDIKPDNILLDANNDCVITDFGISLKAQSTLRKSMRIQANSGTMAYMAPERFSAEPHPIPANDVWSLGAMMFELLEGNVPFLAQMGGLAQMNGAQLPTMHANVGNNLKQTVLSMLDAVADNRPTAAQLVELARVKSTPSNNTASAQNSYSRPNRFEQQPTDEKKTQIINAGAQASAYSRPNQFEQQLVDEKKTQIINSGAQPNTYSRPNRFEQVSANGNSAIYINNNEPKTIKRHGFITFWLWLIIIGNICMVIKAIVQGLDYIDYPELLFAFSISGILSFLNILSAILLLRWKKSGFILFIVTTVLNFAITIFTLYVFSYGMMNVAYCLIYFIAYMIGLVILWGILQIKKDGVSCWSQLK